MRLADIPLTRRDYRVLDLLRDGRWKTIMWLTRHASDETITYQQTGISCALRMLRAHGYPVSKHRIKVDWTSLLYVYGLKKTGEG